MSLTGGMELRHSGYLIQSVRNCMKMQAGRKFKKKDPETCIFDVILVGKEYNPQSFHH